MKKLYLYITILLLASCASVKYVTHSKADELIESLKDLPEYSGSPSVFWDYIVSTNPTYNNYLQDTRTFTEKTRIKFKEKVMTLNSRELYKQDDDEVKMLEALVGIPHSNYINRIVIERSDYSNAYVAPDGVIFISTALLDAGYDSILGVIAHEIAHYVLRHSEVNYVMAERAKRNARTKANIVGTIAYAGAVAGAIAAADAGIRPDAAGKHPSDHLEQIAANITHASQDSFYNNALQINRSYSRDQEIEADIVACKFLQWVGEPVEQYINILKDMHLQDGPMEATMYDTHPLMSIRIKTLQQFFGKKGEP